MDSQILRLLIFSLLVTVSFCSSNLATPLAEFQGNLPVYPGAQVLDSVVLFTGYPGLAQIEVQAASSILICVSPYAAVLSSLQAQCPNPISVKYSSPSPVNEFLLFLDDFSMNFLGQDQKAQNQNKNLEELQVPPYTPLSFQVPLLQDTPYYISIGLAEDVGSNETLRFVEDFVLVNQYPQCETGVPNVSYNGTIGTEPCEEVASSLAKGNQSSPALSVSKINPVLFSFEVGTENLATAAQLDFHINERTYSFTIYVGFEFIPSPTTPNTLVFSNSSSEALFDESYFLGDIVQTYSIVIPNPKQGTYYALVTSNLENLNTSFMIEYNLTTCSIAHNTCDSYNITTYPASDMNVTNITISNVMQYVAVIGDSAIFGIDVNGTGGTVFIQMDINAFPSNTAPYSFYNYDASSTLTLSYGNGSTDQENFVFGLLNKDSLSQDSFTALVWTGSACPGNCSSQGTCDSATTQCSCDKDFEGRYCQSKTSSSHKKLSTLYIILIIIGGAILLAILIGVPVALFLNNRKKARYERV